MCNCIGLQTDIRWAWLPRVHWNLLFYRVIFTAQYLYVSLFRVWHDCYGCMCCWCLSFSLFLVVCLFLSLSLVFYLMWAPVLCLALIIMIQTLVLRGLCPSFLCCISLFWQSLVFLYHNYKIPWFALVRVCFDPFWPIPLMASCTN